jgi:glycosyltransferase involved in cell wall biosynthesis
MTADTRLAVVIPCYRVRAHVMDVLARIPEGVGLIVCVDDCCPDQSGSYIQAMNQDPRVHVVRHLVNHGVGGATMTGYVVAMRLGAEVVVKIDGDGQMDPAMIPNFVEPILAGQADYAKGNRFYDLRSLRGMPKVRIFGNAVLSLMTKLSTGYWNIFDPTNGYTAIHVRVLELLPLDRVARRYFFESDMLFWLSTVRACVVDVPMDAEYASETSNLKITGVLMPFLGNHLRNLGRRFLYNFVLRDFSLATIEIVIGLLAIAFGVTFGAVKWLQSTETGIYASTGTVMLSALPVILGVQLLIAAFGYDVANVPKAAVHRLLGVRRSPQMARRRQAEYATAIAHEPVRATADG